MKSLRARYMEDDPHVYRFRNVFRFMDFCWKHKLGPENSRTEYSSDEDCMYIEDLTQNAPSYKVG